MNILSYSVASAFYRYVPQNTTRLGPVTHEMGHYLVAPELNSPHLPHTHTHTHATNPARKMMRYSSSFSIHFSQQQGVNILSYSTTSAFFRFVSQNMTRLGPVTHEMGHYLGAPELNSPPTYGIGNFDVMGFPYGWDWTQYYPPVMSAYTKNLLGWLNFTTVVFTPQNGYGASVLVNAYPVATYPQVCVCVCVYVCVCVPASITRLPSLESPRGWSLDLLMTRHFPPSLTIVHHVHQIVRRRARS